MCPVHDAQNKENPLLLSFPARNRNTSSVLRTPSSCPSSYFAQQHRQPPRAEAPRPVSCEHANAEDKMGKKRGICGLVASQRAGRRDAPCSACRPQAHTRARTARWQGAGPRSRAQGWVFGARQLPAHSWTSLGPPRVLSTPGFNEGCTQQKGEARACSSSPGPIAA